MVIIASLRGFKMNFLFWTISFCRRQKGKERKKKKKKKKKRRRNLKCENTCGSNSHFDGRILRDETISLFFSVHDNSFFFLFDFFFFFV